MYRYSCSSSLLTSFGLAITLAFPVGALAQSVTPPPNQHLDVQHVSGNVYMISGAGGNIAVQVGKNGVLLVDTGLAQNADLVLAEVQKISPKTIRYILNTHVHPDHTGGNEKIALAGGAIVGGNFAAQVGNEDKRASIVAHQNVLNQMSSPANGETAVSSKAWPTDTFTSGLKKMYFNGEGIELIHIDHAHTDGDSLVYFRGSDVIATGDVFVTTSYPFIDIAHGGNIQGVVAALNRIIEISIPEDRQEGGTYIIPGHGRICDQADVVEYRDMVTIIRDRVRDMVKKGWTLDQVKASNPTLDYDPLYGKPGGRFTKEMFVEAVYKSLSNPVSAKK